MDHFEKYEGMKDDGSNPGQVYRAGKADGLDEITLLRLVRSIFDLSLVEAKQAIGAGEWFDKKQEIKDGMKVYWDSWDTVEGWSLMEARVASVNGAIARLENIKKYRPVDGDLVPVRYEGNGLKELKVSYLERPLTERLAESHLFLRDLAKINDQ